MNPVVETKRYGTAVLDFRKYGDGGRLAIRLLEFEAWTAGQFSPIATLTVNLPDSPLEDGEFFVKGWSENAEIIEDCRKSGLFIDTGKRARTGFVQAEIWRLKDGLYKTS